MKFSDAKQPFILQLLEQGKEKTGNKNSRGDKQDQISMRYLNPLLVFTYTRRD
jgi:hypothetical protein